MAIFAPPSGPAQAASAASGRPATAGAQVTGAKTVVTFAWGGSLASQMPSVPMFRKYGMHATYFVASGLVCPLSRAACQQYSPYLTMSDIRKIAAYGDEIGGLSVLHEKLTTMPAARDLRRPVESLPVGLPAYGLRLPVRGREPNRRGAYATVWLQRRARHRNPEGGGALQ